MKKALLLAALAAAGLQAHALTASFTSPLADRAVYANGFDTPDDLEGWTVDAPWTLSEQIRLIDGDVRPFGTIDPASRLSAACLVTSGTTEASLASPEIEVPAEGAGLRFYAAFSEIWGVFGRLEVSIIDGGSRTRLLESFLWSQEDGNDAGRWLPFRFDLSAWAGRKVKIEFRYVNTGGGDNVYVDGLAITTDDSSDDSCITVREGESVSFTDQSEGATEWEWSLPGAVPAQSYERHPAVAYPAAGSYDVSLTVRDADGNSATAVRRGYVRVTREPAQAAIGRPEGTYLSPWTMFYVPVGVPLTFRDLSSGSPTEWKWTLPGTDIATSTQQNPTATYSAEGTYGIKLHASNEAGGSDDEYVDAIQAGGSQYVWNITPQENGAIDVIALGWYGNYAGTNFLGMDRFAEEFEGPAADATIDAVQAYFGKTAIVEASKDAPVSVSIAKAGDDGAPGEILATTSLPASQLVDGYQDYSPTTFTFDSPATIAKGQPFFVVIGPFPANEDPQSYNVDDIALYCSPRVSDPSERKATMWHFLLDENPDYGGFLDTGRWIRQDEDPGSIAITPHITFAKPQDGIADIAADTSAANLRREGTMLLAEGLILVFAPDGTLAARGRDSIDIASLQPGLYIVRTATGAARIVR